MSVDAIIEAVKAKALSVDSIRSLAYFLANCTKHKSDEIASMIGCRLQRGVIYREEAECLMSASSEINLTVWDEVEPFFQQRQGK